MERASRFTILVHLPGRHTAEEVRDALIDALSGLPPGLHHDITQALSMPVFCQKASAWQRPSNENTNGLLRQYSAPAVSRLARRSTTSPRRGSSAA